MGLLQNDKFEAQNMIFGADRQRHHAGSGRLAKLTGFLIGEYTSGTARATCHFSSFSFEPL
jgi:hypothetical protein